MQLSDADRHVLAVAGVLVVFCGISMAMSFRALSLARAAEGDAGGGTKAALAKMEKRLYSLGRRLESLRDSIRLTSDSSGGGPPGRGGPGQFGQGGPQGGPGNFQGGPPGMGGMPTLGSQSNLAALAQTLGNVDPEVFEHMAQRHARRKALSEHRQKTMARVKLQLSQDEARYEGDERLMDLYEAATDRENENRAESLTALLDEYEGSAAAGMALAEAALDSVKESDTATVEAYYEALVSGGTYSDIVTELGVEAIPTLQNNLVKRYIREGRYDDAAAMVESMTDYTDSYASTRSAGGQQNLVAVGDVVERISGVVESLQAGDTSVLESRPAGSAPRGGDAGGFGPSTGGAGGGGPGGGGAGGGRGGGGGRGPGR